MWAVDAIKFRLGRLRYFAHHVGFLFDCPICDGRWRRMLAYEAHYSLRGEDVDCFTENAICPGCRSHIRHRFIAAYLRDRTDLLTGGRKLLHFAPEPALGRMLRACTNYVATDIDPSLFDDGCVRADITALPWSSSYFDAIVCSQVLNVIKDDDIALAELLRVLRPGGHAIITVPIYGAHTAENPLLTEADRVREYGVAEHCRMYGLDIMDKMRRAGFDVSLVPIETLNGCFVDRAVRSPHTESDRYLFDCVKP